MMTTALVAALLLAQAPPPVPPAPEAAPPAARTDQPVLGGFETPTGKKFTGEFKDRPVGEALREVARSAGLSIVLPSGLYGTVNADFAAAPVEDVLRVLLEQNGLRAERTGSIVTVTRVGGGSLVISGGKRKIRFGAGEEGFRVDIDPDEIAREAEEAARGAERDARQVEKEAAAEAKRERRERRGDRADDRVLSGNQVVKAGDRVGSLVVLRGNVLLEAGSRAAEVVAVLGSVEVGPGVMIEGEVVAVGGDVHVRPGAFVEGDVVSVGGKLVLDEGARIDGQQTAVDIPGLGGLLSAAGARPFSAQTTSPALRVGQAIAQFAMFLALGLLLLVLTPRRVEVVGRSLTNSPSKALLTGFLGTLALPVLALLLVVTIVGIPLVAVLILGVVAATILGFTALAQSIGERVPIGRGGQVLRLAIGTALVVAATKIPFLGILVWVAAWFFLFGAVLRTRFGQQPAIVPAMQMPPPFPPSAGPPPPAPPPPSAPPATSPPAAP